KNDARIARAPERIFAEQSCGARAPQAVLCERADDGVALDRRDAVAERGEVHGVAAQSGRRVYDMAISGTKRAPQRIAARAAGAITPQLRRGELDVQARAAAR